MAQKKTEKKSEKENILQLLDNDTLHAQFVDTFTLLLRSDNIAMIKFYLRAPENKAVEQARIVSTTAGLKLFIDMLCKNLNYYPNLEEKNKDIEK